jgi:hypothetical protein
VDLPPDEAFLTMVHLCVLHASSSSICKSCSRLSFYGRILVCLSIASHAGISARVLMAVHWSKTCDRPARTLKFVNQ